MEQDVIHGKNALGNIVVVYDRQPMNLVLGHCPERLVNFVVRLARENENRGNFSDREITGQAVPGSQRDANVAICHDA
jgi:hypothetical protein